MFGVGTVFVVGHFQSHIAASPTDHEPDVKDRSMSRYVVYSVSNCVACTLSPSYIRTTCCFYTIRCMIQQRDFGVTHWVDSRLLISLSSAYLSSRSLVSHGVSSKFPLDRDFSFVYSGVGSVYRADLSSRVSRWLDLFVAVCDNSLYLYTFIPDPIFL